MCGSQRTTCGTWFSPSVWVPGGYSGGQHLYPLSHLTCPSVLVLSRLLTVECIVSFTFFGAEGVTRALCVPSMHSITMSHAGLLLPFMSGEMLVPAVPASILHSSSTSDFFLRNKQMLMEDRCSVFHMCCFGVTSASQVPASRPNRVSNLET